MLSLLFLTDDGGMVDGVLYDSKLVRKHIFIEDY